LILRRKAFAALATTFILIGVGAAQAGGTWFEQSDSRVEAGDELRLTATVGRGVLGWIEDGPFFVYLQGDEFGLVVTEGSGASAETDVALGELEVVEQIQNLVVTASVTIPEATPPGEYWVAVCNDPCTTGLGDLIGAILYVGVDAPSAESTTLAVLTASEPETLPQRLALPPYPERPTRLSPVWVGISAALGGAVMLTALLFRQRS
jgi:hypothetical protein